MILVLVIFPFPYSFVIGILMKHSIVGALSHSSLNSPLFSGALFNILFSYSFNMYPAILTDM